MKTIILILSVFLVISCNNDDSSPTESHEILGNWYLIKYEPGFSPIDNYIDEIQWTFNSDNTVDVVIENGTNPNSSLPLNTNGNYTYSIDNETLILNNNDDYNYEIIDNELFLTKFIGVEADGPRITLKKIE